MLTIPVIPNGARAQVELHTRPRLIAQGDIVYITATTYITPEQIVSVVGPAWADPASYLVEIKGPAITNWRYMAFVSRKTLADLCWPPCEVCDGRGWVWASARGDEVEKEPCPKCAP